MRPVFRTLLYLVFFYLACGLVVLLFGVYAQSQKSAVVEAVVRAHARTAIMPVVFVSVADRDIDDSVLHRLGNSKVLVRKMSQGIPRPGRFGDSWDTLYIDMATGQVGRPMYIGEMSWLGPWKTGVEVGHPGHSERFTVTRTLRGWVVTGRVPTWIA